ncbi:MAG: hypothetical protein M1546_01965 [Chloroflexi bacterium]|nr:hypothetical protein [Chloroflexota bacterium]
MLLVLARSIQHGIQASAAGFTVFALALLTACVSPGPVVTPTSILTAVPPTASSSEDELRIYGFLGSVDSVVNTLAQGFARKHPEIKLKITAHAFTKMPAEELPDLVKAGKPPDLILNIDGVTPYLVENDLVLNLREFMAADLQFNLDDIHTLTKYLCIKWRLPYTLLTIRRHAATCTLVKQGQ